MFSSFASFLMVKFFAIERAVAIFCASAFCCEAKRKKEEQQDLQGQAKQEGEETSSSEERGKDVEALTASLAASSRAC